MNLVLALEYEDTFSVTAVIFSKISWRSVTIEDWTIGKYHDVFLVT